MWRALRFLAVLGAVAAGAAWLADQQGSAIFEWRGYRVETTTAVLVAAVMAVAVVVALLYRLWLFMCRVPAALGRVRRAGRRRRGYLALTRGMVAVAAGDAEDARRQGKRAEGLLGDPPLTMLLSAQAAQLAGDERAAEKFFKAMLERPETEFLGVRGLLTQSLKQDDRGQALALARRAYRLKPKSEWVAAHLFDLQLRAEQWADAEMTLAASVRGGLVGADDGERRRAVLLHQRSLEAGVRADGAASLRLARQAFELDPAFVPGAVRLAHLLVAAGKERKAVQAVERAWRRQPHPDLAEVYWAARPGADALDRLRALQHLADLNPDHVESHVTVARAALEARLWGEARKHLEAANGAAASAPVCRLMAELEESENGDTARAHEWLMRASVADPGPAWVCGDCGMVVAEWTVLCPKCASFDSLAWRRPPGAASLAAGTQAEATAALPAADGAPG
ncbi:MAG TPA: heme biosynthesis HemY N-terminal domain-containing protein [Rhodospirillales bacterium]|nr:heme biosynthesis HemY N-terminal domain-containing protein [Rhodospirillales bacterium]